MNAVRSLPSATFRAAAEFSFAAREQRARRELFALGGVVAAVLATVALSLRGFDGGSGAGPENLGPVSSADASSLEPAPTRYASAARSELARGPELLADDAPAIEPPASTSTRSSRPRDKWKESDFYAEFCALEGRAEFDAAVESALDGTRAPAESLAALRAAYDVRGEASAKHFVRAAAELGEPSTPGHATLPRASVHWLAQRASRESAARAVLETLAFEAHVETDVRAAGAFALMMAAPQDELERIERRFERERDEQVLASVSSALQARRRSAETNAARDEAEEPRE
jgi:hypothetical protein